MSRHPSPGSAHPHTISVFQQAPPPQMVAPLRQKSKAYSTGIAAGAEDVKYQAKYKELKRKVKEIEADNDKLYYKVLQAKRSIQRMKLEQGILYERLSTSPISQDVQDRHAIPPTHLGQGVQQPQPLAPPPNMHPHVSSHQHQQIPQHNHHGQHLSHRDSREHHPHPHALPPGHAPSQGDPHDFIDFMRAQQQQANNAGVPIHLSSGTDSRPIPVTEMMPAAGIQPVPHHPSRSNSSSAGGNGGTPTVSSSVATPLDSSLQLPPLPQSYDRARDYNRQQALVQDRLRMSAAPSPSGGIPARGRPDLEVVYGPQGLPQAPPQQPSYAPEGHPHMQHPRERSRRHDPHEFAGEYAQTGSIRVHNHQQRMGPGASYIGEHVPHPHHGHGHPNEWERGGREYGPTGTRVEPPSAGAPYRGEWRGEHGEPLQQHGMVTSRSGTPGSAVNDGMSRGELAYDRGRFGMRPVSQPRETDADVGGEPEEMGGTGRHAPGGSKYEPEESGDVVSRKRKRSIDDVAETDRAMT